MQHQTYCGIDLHARSMYVWSLSQADAILRHRHMKAKPAPFLKAIALDRAERVVAVEYLFTWDWLADLCAQAGLPFVLGNASLQWVFSEAAGRFLRDHPAGPQFLACMENTHGIGQTTPNPFSGDICLLTTKGLIRVRLSLESV